MYIIYVFYIMNFTLVHVGMLYMQYYSISCAVTWYIRHNKRSNMAWCPHWMMLANYFYIKLGVYLLL